MKINNKLVDTLNKTSAELFNQKIGKLLEHKLKNEHT